jgi:hypothetical protein
MHMHTHVHTDTKVAVAGQQIVKQVCVVSLLSDHSGTQYEHRCIHTHTQTYTKSGNCLLFLQFESSGFNMFTNPVNSDSATCFVFGVFSSLLFSFFNHRCQTSGVDPAG